MCLQTTAESLEHDLNADYLWSLIGSLDMNNLGKKNLQQYKLQ